MAEQRLIRTAFWDDHYISNLDRLERYMFLYLLTNPHTNISGIYQLNMKYVMIDTGFTQSEALAIFKKFERDGKARYHDGWIVMRNWIKHQKTGSKDVEKGINKYVERSPKWCQEYIRDKESAETLPPECGDSMTPELESKLELESELEITTEVVRRVSPDEKPLKGENMEITAIIERLLAYIHIDDFKETKREQRIHAKNLMALESKIGKNEFERRLRKIKADEFKWNQSNSIGYLYREMKATKDPKIKQKATREESEKSEAEVEAERKKQETEERKRLEDIFQNLSQDEQSKIDTEARASLAKMKITPESEAKK